MAGVNPALLAHLSGNANGPPAAPKPPAPPGDPGSEDGDKPLSQACSELAETVKTASKLATDLQDQAEMADDIDASAERAITQAAQLLAQADGLLTKVSQSLGAAAGDGSVDMPDDTGDAAY